VSRSHAASTIAPEKTRSSGRVVSCCLGCGIVREGSVVVCCRGRTEAPTERDQIAMIVCAHYFVFSSHGETRHTMPSSRARTACVHGITGLVVMMADELWCGIVQMIDTTCCRRPLN